MPELQPRASVLLLLAAFSRDREALAWTRQRAQAEFGPLALESDVFDFSQTQYYEPTMGGPLRKQFFAFQRLVDPADLSEIKRQTIGWEREYAEETQGPDPRPLNLDPGYLELAKLVLASTKDHAHRIYVGGGIYAEVTLHYRRDGGWQPWPWTFPDYRRPEYHAFFDRCREYLISRRATE